MGVVNCLLVVVAVVAVAPAAVVVVVVVLRMLLYHARGRRRLLLCVEALDETGSRGSVAIGATALTACSPCKCLGLVAADGCRMLLAAPLEFLV